MDRSITFPRLLGSIFSPSSPPPREERSPLRRGLSLEELPSLTIQLILKALLNEPGGFRDVAYSVSALNRRFRKEALYLIFRRILLKEPSYVFRPRSSSEFFSLGSYLEGLDVSFRAVDFSHLDLPPSRALSFIASQDARILERVSLPKVPLTIKRESVFPFEKLSKGEHLEELAMGGVTLPKEMARAFSELLLAHPRLKRVEIQGFPSPFEWPLHPVARAILGLSELKSLSIAWKRPAFLSSFEFPSWLSEIKSLEELEIEGAHSLLFGVLSDEVPYPNLKRLTLKAVSGLEGAVGALSHLEEFSLEESCSAEALLSQWIALGFFKRPPSRSTLSQQIGTYLWLKELTISRCDLRRLPEEIGFLTELEGLTISFNPHLEAPLPKKIGHLKRLKRVTIASNPSLKRLFGFQEMTALEEIYVLESDLEFPPQGFLALLHLKRIDYSGSPFLIHKCYHWPHELEELIFQRSKLRQVPLELGYFPLFKRADFSGSTFLTNADFKVDYTRTNLEELNLSGTSISRLPEEIYRINKLKRLDLSFCKSLRSFGSRPILPYHLEVLTLKGSAVKELPKIDWVVGRLKRLDLSECCSLKRLEGEFDREHLLVELELSGTALEELPVSLGRLSRCERLDLSHCLKLKRLPDSIGELSSLSVLLLSESGLVELPETIGGLKKLERLDLSKCRSLKRLPDTIGQLQELRDLSLNESGLVELPRTIGELKKLKGLDLSGCRSLKRQPDFTG